MHVKRIYRPTVREALAEAREMLGPGALVLSTELVPAPGWRGWMGRRVVRLTAAAERPENEAAAPSGVSDDRRVVTVDRTIEAHTSGRPARIRMKMNSLLDPRMIRALYRASQAGVEIRLNVRGICALRPGVEGVSENIEVVSVLGRFLEHSRIFWFRNDGNEEMYIGSADLMERNLDRRVETLTPVRDPEIVAHLRDVVLAAYLRDTDRAMILDAAGHYTRPDAAAGRFNAMDFLLKQYADLQNE